MASRELRAGQSLLTGMRSVVLDEVVLLGVGDRDCVHHAGNYFIIAGVSHVQVHAHASGLFLLSARPRHDKRFVLVAHSDRLDTCPFRRLLVSNPLVSMIF